MSNVVAQTTRGPLAENLIRGHLAVVDGEGGVRAAVGDPDYLTYMRSAAKPLQASAAVESGAADHFCFTQAELAIMCGSHLGADYQAAAVLSVLDKLGLSENDLTLGPELSMSKSLREQRILSQIAPRRIFNNCSGKHSCMLALCRHMGWETAGYQQPEHPAQLLIKSVVAAYCQYPANEIVVGVDGCGVPVFGLPLRQMAVAYRNLTSPERHLPPERAQAARRIINAMTAAPEMVAGWKHFCTELIAATQGRIIGKLGADGVYCCGLRDGELGLALKIESGDGAALAPVMLRALSQLGLLRREEEQALAHFAARDLRNWQQDVVGRLEAVFEL